MNQNQEIFRAVDGYAKYEISTHGRVRNATTERILKIKYHNGYVTVGLQKDKKRHGLSVHRLVAVAFIPNPNKLPLVDHIDGDKQNNMPGNLRWVTKSQNGMNRNRKQPIGTSTYKGVYYHKGNKRWAASIGFNNKCNHIGYFETEQDAAKAYNDKAIELFKEYAKLNVL